MQDKEDSDLTSPQFAFASLVDTPSGFPSQRTPGGVDVEVLCPRVVHPLYIYINQWNPKYGCKGTVTTRFALIALVAWQYYFDSTLRKLLVHPKYG